MAFSGSGLAGRPFASFALAAAVAMSAVSGAGTQAKSADGRHVMASLVAETQNLVPGQPLRLALRQQIEPGWHTYWSNPGESGAPTTLDWKLPDGFKAGSIAWPTRFRRPTTSSQA